MLAIADQRVEVSLGDAKVPALRVGTGVALRVDADGAPLGDFSLHARDTQVQALEPTGQERRDDRRGHRLGCGASTDGEACYAGLLLVWSKAENGASHDARASPDREGGRPRAGIRRHEWAERSSLLKMGRRENFSRSKDTASLPCCQANGREGRIIHHQQRQYPWIKLVHSGEKCLYIAELKDLEEWENQFM